MDRVGNATQKTEKLLYPPNPKQNRNLSIRKVEAGGPEVPWPMSRSRLRPEHGLLRTYLKNKPK